MRMTCGVVLKTWKWKWKTSASGLRRNIAANFLQPTCCHNGLEFQGRGNGKLGTPPSTERVRINVSGATFETTRAVLSRHPNTLLGDPSKCARYWDAARSEYFLDRHRPSFEAIFDYLVHGERLIRPDHVPGDIFLSEVGIYLCIFLFKCYSPKPTSSE